MSWSMNAKGTEEAIIRSLAGQKVYGDHPDEQAVFDDCRAKVIELVKKSQRPTDDNMITIHDVHASGHGVFVGQFRIASEWVFLK